jgi:phospholipase C
MERIEQWVVVMFENRSFDSLLGHLPHIDAADSLREREIVLPYPGGEVRVTPDARPHDPLPDPGEGFGNVNTQLFGAYEPPSNLGRAAYPLFPDFMEAPFNAPAEPRVPTMDGFALDFYGNFRWEKEREPSAEEMATIGRVFTPRTAPVINTLAQEYAVFTRWFCEVPTCTFPNRSFFHGATSLGKLDNEAIVNYAWDQEMPNLFELFAERGLPWHVYYDHSQKVADCAINVAGLRHIKMWKEHALDREQFFADAAAGALPAYSWVEPNLMFGELDDYHPPTDIRAGELLLARIYEAVRNSPQWESTALVVLFDEHGGCFDHVPPPAAPIPDDSPGEQGFAFDRFGVRVPAIVVSPYTERGTVISDTFHTTSVLRTLRERFDLGPALTNRDAAAPLLDVAFNRSEPRQDAPAIEPLPFVEPPPLTEEQKQEAFGDAPDAGLLLAKRREAAKEHVSQIGEATLRNVARLAERDLDDLPSTASAAREWLDQHAGPVFKDKRR